MVKYIKKIEKVSIIIPVYNTEQYLKECIESVLGQSYDNWELILVDDGSEDSSPKICADFSCRDNRIKFIQQNHLGIGAARVLGIKNTTGKYISFIDSDDWIEESMLAKLMHPFQVETDIDISICSLVIYNRNGYKEMCSSKSNEYRIYTNDKAIELMFANKEYNWSLCGKIYKRELFKKNECIYTDWPAGYGEDTYVNWRIFNSAKKVAYVSMSGYHYRYNQKSTMNQMLSEKKLVYLSIWDDILEEIDDVNRPVSQNIMDEMFSFGISILTEFMEMNLPRNDAWYKGRDILKKYLESYIKRDDENVRTSYIKLMLTDEKLKQREKDYIDDLNKFCHKYKKVYIYGAGKIAAIIAKLMIRENIKFQGFLVSDNGNNEKVLYDHVVARFDAIIKQYNNERIGIVTGVNRKNLKAIMPMLDQVNTCDVFEGGKISLRY